MGNVDESLGFLKYFGLLVSCGERRGWVPYEVAGFLAFYYFDGVCLEYHSDNW